MQSVRRGKIMKTKTQILNEIIEANNIATLDMVKRIQELEGKVESNNIDIQYLKYVLAGFEIMVKKLKKK